MKAECLGPPEQEMRLSHPAGAVSETPGYFQPVWSAERGVCDEEHPSSWVTFPEHQNHSESAGLKAFTILFYPANSSIFGFQNSTGPFKEALFLKRRQLAG